MIDGTHAFRQAQTAISTYYTIEEGFTIKYITPVLGAPWSIPLEFPFYQWIVALTVLMLKTPLERTGRFVSLLFFYLSMLPIYSIVGYFIKEKKYKYIILSCILVNPIYVFWSQTFMIESVALFWSVLFVWGTAKALEHHNKISYIIIGVMAGTLSGVTKVTTFVVFCLPVFIFFVFFWLNEKRSRFSFNVLKRYVIYGVILFGIPLIFTLTWTRFADYQKSLNPLASDFITSTASYHWNFGTFQQKFSYVTWQKIFERTHVIKLFGETHLFGIKWINFFLITGLFIVLDHRRRTEVILLLLCFLFAPIVFTNLYYVHDYYFYANNLFLSILLGIIITSLLEIRNKSLQVLIVIFILPLLLFSLFAEYKSSYYPSQIELQQQGMKYYKNIIQIIKIIIPKDDVLLIYGRDWDSTMPYYFERKSIMDMWELPITDKKIQESFKNLKEDNLKIGGMVIFGDREESFIKERVDYLNLNPVPIYASGAKIYWNKANDAAIDRLRKILSNIPEQIAKDSTILPNSQIFQEFLRCSSCDREIFQWYSLFSLFQSNAPIMGLLETINGRRVDSPQPITISNDEILANIIGWAVDGNTKVAGGVQIDIDGKLYPAIYGQDRNDVATYFKIPNYRYSGYWVSIPTDKIGIGEHILTLKILTNDRTGYYTSQQTVRFIINPR